jgi:hypothetical protein
MSSDKCTITGHVLFSLENPRLGKGIIIGLLVPATVIPIVVLMGIILALGIALVYLLILKKSSKSLTNNR